MQGVLSHTIDSMALFGGMYLYLMMYQQLPHTHSSNGRELAARDRDTAASRTVVDDGVVDLGRFSCFSCLAAWQQPIEPGVQQLPAAVWRVAAELELSCSILSTNEAHEARGSFSGLADRSRTGVPSTARCPRVISEMRG